MKIPLAANNKINGGKISGGFRLAQQLSNPGWHIVSCDKMAARAPVITAAFKVGGRKKDPWGRTLPLFYESLP